MIPALVGLRGRSASVSLTLGIFVLWPLALLAQPPTDGDQTQATNSQLLAFAKTRVFKFVVETPEGTKVGSGILVKFEKTTGKQDTGTFVTVYHVLQGARNITIVGHDGRTLAKSSPTSIASGYAARNRELAFVRLKLQPENCLEFHETSTVSRFEGPVGLLGPKEKPTGIAFGYSQEGTIPLDYSRIEFLGTIRAGDLPGLIDESVEADPLQLAPSNLLLRLLTDQATMAGMSGGLVLDRRERFGGLVFGRRTDKYNLIIPAEEVDATWNRAKSSPDLWKPLDTGLFSDRSFFAGGQGSSDRVDIDRIDWGTSDSLTVLLGADPSQAIGQFQEIVFEPPKSGPHASDLELYVDENGTLPDEKHGLEFSLDGRRLPWSRRVPGKGPDLLRIPLGERTGERLLIVVKETGRVNDLELGGLFASSKIDLTFRQDGKAFRRLIRSLPRIIQRYPIFVTIRNGSPLAALNRRSIGVATTEAATKPPANARIAIRLDFVEAVLRRAPLLLRMRHGPDEKGSEFKGFFEMDHEKGWDVNRVSPQRVGLVMRGQVRIQKARYQAFGIAVQRNEDADPFHLEIRGRLQFPPDLGNFFFSARASGTAGNEPFRIELSKDLSLDVGGFLRSVFTCYVNNQLLLPTDPRAQSRDKVNEFIAQVGLSAEPDWSLEPRQILVVPGDDGFPWIVATARLEPKDKREPNSKLIRTSSHSEGSPMPDINLLQPPDAPSGVVFDISAREIPAIAIAHFPGLGRVNPIVEEVLSPSTIGDIRLTSSLLPGTSLGASPDKIDAIPVQDDDGKRLAARIRAVFTETVQGGGSALDVTVGHDLARRTLQRALGRPNLDLQSDGSGVLHVSAVSRPGSSRVDLNVEGGSCAFATPRDKVIDLGDGASLKDARLVVSQLDAGGTGDQNRVKARLAALVDVGYLKFGAVEFLGLSGGITGVIDTGEAELAQLRLEIRGGRALISGKGPVALGPIKDIRVTISREGTFRFDKAQLMDILVKQLLGVP